MSDVFQEVDEESKKIILMLDGGTDGVVNDGEETKKPQKDEVEKIEVPQEIIDSVEKSDLEGDGESDSSN